jgi:hypothetical protein
MNPPSPAAPGWPNPASALDDTLDLAGVMASTGCTEQDFVELSAIFLQEQANMTGRLNRAVEALSAGGQDSPTWPEAVEQLRTAAHELTTSFGIIGARQAEVFSRHTQLRTRKGSALADPPPSAADLLTAAQALLGAVNRSVELLRRRG